MDTLFLEIFGPFVFFGSILTLVYIYQRLRDARRRPSEEASEDEEQDRPDD